MSQQAREPQMPQVEMSDHFTIRIETGEIITWGEYKSRKGLAAPPPPTGGTAVITINEAILNVAAGRCERQGRQGLWRVYTEGKAVYLEEYPNAPRKVATTAG